MNTTNGIISQPSPYSVTETVDRLAAILQAKDITMFARIDQQIEAEKRQLELTGFNDSMNTESIMFLEYRVITFWGLISC